MATIRAYSGENRLATAVHRPRHGNLLQVFPEKKEFASEAEWRKEYPTADRFETEEPKSKAKPKMSSLRRTRRDREIMEFFDPSLTWLKNVIVEKDTDGEPLVRVTLSNNHVWTIKRCENYFVAPKVTKNGMPYNRFDSCFSPALTSLKWFIMMSCECNL